MWGGRPRATAGGLPTHRPRSTSTCSGVLAGALGPRLLQLQEPLEDEILHGANGVKGRGRAGVVRELCAGKNFEFKALAEATLNGFAEPVALYEVRPT